MGEVDSIFINPIELRPKLIKIEDNTIPVIDVSSISSLDHLPNTNAAVTDPKIRGLVAEIHDACEKWGFFQVVNTGILPETITKLENAALKFLDQPKDEKIKVYRCPNNPMGYYDDEYSDNVKDWKEGLDFAGHDSTLALVSPHEPLSNRWPEYPPELRDVAEEYAKEVTKLVMKVLELIALSLDLPSDRLTKFFKEPCVIGRISRYMACHCPDLVLGIGPHKDSVALSVISQDDVGGLQVRRKSDGEWITVTPIRGAFVINIADIIQIWSNDKYESVEHRVILNPEKDRHSIALFYGPSYNVNVKPLEEFVDEHNPAKYEEFNHGQFRASLLKSYVPKP